MAAQKKLEAARPYQPTPAEQMAIEKHKARRGARAPLVPLKVVGMQDGKGTIQVDHKASVAEPLFCEQFATDDSVFASYVAEQLGMLSVVNGELSANVLNAHLSTVRAIGPRDEVETLLACQMAAVHVVTMSAAVGLTKGSTGPTGDMKISQLNKLSRTFAAQMEALKRYRSKGDQKVTVEHVHVHPGGQAVVGNLTQQTGSIDDNMCLPERPAVLGSLETDEMPVQGTGSGGVERLPVSRRERRSTIRAVQ